MIVRRISRFAAAVLSLIYAANAIVASASGDTGPPGKDTCTISVPFTVTDEKGWIPDGTIFTVEMAALDGAPLPDKTLYEINVSGEYEFGPIVFDEPGDYEYTISEWMFDDDKIIFDETVYHVHVVILYNDDGELVGGFSLTKDESYSKQEYAEFDNDYIEPPDSPYSETDSSNTDDSSDTDDNSDTDDSVDSSDSDDSSSKGGDGSDSGGNSSDADGGSSSSRGGNDGGSSSSNSTPQDGLLPPDTGSALTIGISGLMAFGLALMVVSRKSNDAEDEPHDDGTG